MVEFLTRQEPSSREAVLGGVCRRLALLYAARERPEAQEDAAAQTDSWLVEHVLYGAFRSMLLVGGECERGSVFKLVDLVRLYRVFERC